MVCIAATILKGKFIVYSMSDAKKDLLICKIDIFCAIFLFLKIISIKKICVTTGS